ncbi:nuclear transport factor 2-like protein [Mucilaginibacter segetis]|uniref:Uncharacterized protein n=1 Tax=Mucilaginibacter segetis TaxID=2793071 RepID=A0A934PT90_9SPHI|nr:nuclear transport factor 2 family protein [Mucilaginibacter segetis]MBK0379186.1 hypothetical protein [Mucilaginibacter segetis]
MSKKEQSEVLIAEHFKLLNDHNLKALTQQYATTASISSSEWNGIAIGPAGADQIFHLEFYKSPDAKYLVDNIINNDSTLVVQYDVVGLRDINNGNTRYDLRKCSVFKIDSNLIVNEATYANPLFYHNGN